MSKYRSTKQAHLSSIAVDLSRKWAISVRMDALNFAHSNIKQIATSDVEDGYLKEAMLPVYAEAAAKAGELTSQLWPSHVTDYAEGIGAYRKRIKIIGDAISQGKLFGGIRNAVKDVFDGAFDAKRDVLIGEVRKVFDKILKDFDLKYVVEELPNSDRDELRHEMQKFVLEATAEIDEDIIFKLANAETDSANERRNYE